MAEGETSARTPPPPTGGLGSTRRRRFLSFQTLSLCARLAEQMPRVLPNLLNSALHHTLSWGALCFMCSHLKPLYPKRPRFPGGPSMRPAPSSDGETQTPKAEGIAQPLNVRFGSEPRSPERSAQGTMLLLWGSNSGGPGPRQVLRRCPCVIASFPRTRNSSRDWPVIHFCTYQEF